MCCCITVDGCKIKEKKENAVLLYKCIGEMLQLVYIGTYKGGDWGQNIISLVYAES